MLRRIVYTSVAAEGVGTTDVYNIIRSAHNRNSQAGLTGGLVFLDGWFFQVLEGLPAAVEQCYARIANDPRHHSLQMRQDTQAAEPLFESEWMALRQASQIDPGVLAAAGYEPGLPAESFSGDDVLNFVVACFAHSAAPC